MAETKQPAADGRALSEGLGLAPKVGRWRAYCCLCDLHPIATAEDVAEAEKFSREMWPAMVFETLGDAVAALRGELPPEEEAAELARVGWKA